MFKLALISIVFLPAVLGLIAARSRRARNGLSLLLVSVLVYDVLYLLMLYYLRIRWVG